MCGLVGLVSTERGVGVHKRKEVFTELLFIDTLRGRHSAGVSTVGFPKPKDEGPSEVRIFKKAVPGSDLVSMEGYDQILDTFSDSVAVLGHNRHRTYGEIVDRNAHPFIFGNIVLAHNGSLTGKGDLESYNLSKHIDSANIAINMNSMGELPCLEALDGAFALTWFNLKDNTMNFARNKDRPLFFATVKGENTLIWASEPLMLHWVLGRADLEIEKVFFPPPLTHIKIKPENVRKNEFHKFMEYTYHYKYPAMGYVRDTDTGRFSSAMKDKDARLGEGKTDSGGTSIRYKLRELYDAGFRPDQDEIMQITKFEEPAHGNKKGTIYGRVYKGTKAYPVVMFAYKKKAYDQMVAQADYHKVSIASMQVMGDDAIMVVKYCEALIPGKAVKFNGTVMTPKKKEEPTVKIPEPKERTGAKDGECYGPQGTPIPEARYLMLVADGCTGCGRKDVVGPFHDEQLVWTSGKDPKPVCAECQQNASIMALLGYQVGKKDEDQDLYALGLTEL